MFTTKQIDLIDEKEFTKAILDKNSETFVTYVVSFSLGLNLNYLNKKTQIAFLIAKKVKILEEYSDFADIFLKKKPMLLSN